MADNCPSCGFALSRWKKLVSVRPFRFDCPTCGTPLESREPGALELTANFIAQVVAIIAFLMLFGRFRIDALSSTVVAFAVYLAIVFLPVIFFGKFQIRKK